MKSLVLLLLCTTAAHAQYTLVPSSQYSRSLPISQAKAVNMFDLFNNPLDEAHEYKGSPYLTKEFVKGVVETDKGKFSGLNMRYDIYSDIIEIPDHQAEMEKFSHSDDTSPKKPECLKRFAQQYNRLVK